MKRYSLLSLLLVFALMLTLFAGCGTKPDSSAASAAAETSEAAPVEADEVSAAEPDEAPSAPAEVPEDSSLEESTEETPVLRESISYPLCEPGELEFSVFTSAGGPGGSVESLYEYPAYQIAEECTGVKIISNLSTPEAVEAKLNLIIASGDMPTFFTGLDMYYPTGRSAAIEDEVIVDLADYLEECAPDYMNYLDTVPGLLRNMTTDHGEVPFIAPKAATNYSGLSIRQDWLDIVGMDIPQTYDELEAVLAAFKSEFGCSDALLLNSKFCGDNNTLSAGYGLNMLRGNIGSLAFEAVDGKVELFCQGKGFKEYMSMLADWHSKGYFTSYMEVGPFNADQFIGSDNAGIWAGGNSQLADDWASANYTGAYDFKAVPMADVTKTPGEATELGGLSVTVDGEHSWVVTTSCEDVENAVKWLNWWFTEEGSMAGNFGREGETYYMDGDTPVFTDLILNNPDGYIMFVAKMLFLGNSTPAAEHPARLDPRNTLENEAQLSVKEVWYPENRGIGYTCYGDMTAVESELYAAKAGDIATYLEEYMAKVIEGVEDIDTTYDSMIQNCFDLGLQEVLDIKQAAYDRYLNR